MRAIPDELRDGPFTRAQALAAGVTRTMLRGKRFERIHHGVYRIAGTPISHDERVHAARLALPKSAKLTGISRIQEIGLDFGPRLPIHFVVPGDLHLELEGVFLHRTKALAPCTGDQMSVEGAFIAYCAVARTVDAIQVGDWLVHRLHMSIPRLVEIAGAHLWRAGAYEALYVSNFLTDRARSLKESETGACLRFAGLPAPEFNLTLEIPDREVIGDLVYRTLRLVVEYEGRHHQEDRDQYNQDIDRYKLMRDYRYRYLQVTSEKLQRPQVLVRAVHAEMVAAGYDGPGPLFEETWRLLFTPMRRFVGRRHPDARAA
jgi:very-short-patch-repair endonuclease